MTNKNVNNLLYCLIILKKYSLLIFTNTTHTPSKHFACLEVFDKMCLSITEMDIK